VSHGSGARESWGSYSPDGKRLVYVTDETGEESIVTADAWGRGDRKTIVPAGESGWHFPPLWSPDGKWVAYADQTYALYVVPAEGGAPTLAARGAYWEISEYAWSPDGRWLAYTDWLPSEFRVIKIYDTKEKKTVQVTGGTTDSWSPVWDPEGRYLYFLSNRSVNPLLGSRDMEDILLKPVLPYAILLRPDVENPFAEKGGLPDGDKDKKAEEKGDKDNKGEEAPQPVAIDFDGIADRVAEVPADAGFYGRLSATATHLFYVSYPIKGMAEEPPLFAEEAEGENTLMSFDLEKKKARTFMDHMTAYELAAKGEKLAVLKKPGSLYVVEAGSPPGDDLSENQVSWDGIVLELDPRAEWKQMYYEGWRNMRDFFWDPGMGGVDWKAVRDRYATLLPRLATRSDLVDLMGEVIGELSNSHTYVFGGDPGKKVPHVSVGLLGADVAREGDAFRVTRIYRGDPADREPSPLDAPGVKVKEGDYILAVNHLPFPPGEPFYSRFEDLAGKTVTLTVNTRPDRKTARDVVVTPLGDDHRLHYVDWTRRNREYVDRKTGGKIGYLHLPDMMTDGLVQFDTWFYPQIRKEGMIIDGRWNGGGFLSQLIVERMRRKVISFDRNRAGNVSGTYPWRAINGPFVVLTNQFAGSDGDIFPAAVQMEGLAPVIGKRTWGGVIGIRADKRLVDGGWLTEPEFAWWDPQRGYGLENRGAVPDIEVEDLPQDVARGVDAQLDRAIAEAMRLHEEHPPLRPDFGPTPVKTRKAYQEKE
jgi:tricorn protease